MTLPKLPYMQPHMTQAHYTNLWNLWVGEFNKAVDEANELLSKLTPVGVDTDTHWANGVPRLLTPEAYALMTSEEFGVPVTGKEEQA